MKKKILIGSVFAVLLMLSMPAISNIQAQPAPATIEKEETDECSICPYEPLFGENICEALRNWLHNAPPDHEVINAIITLVLLPVFLWCLKNNF